MWDDGAVDGDPQPAVAERALAHRRVLHLRTLVNALAVIDVVDLATLRLAFTAMDRSDRSLENARNEALADRARLQTSDLESITSWLAARVAEYSAWLRRCERGAEQ